MSSKPPHVEENVFLAPHTYFRIGGPAKYFAHITNEQELASAVAFAHENNLRFTTLSGGSNVLVSDEGFDGLVLHMETRDIRVQGNTITTESGVAMATLVRIATEHALTGLEWAIGIPGMVGGSVRGNAGCFGGEIKDVLTSVRVFDAEKCEWKEFSREECVFDYRESMLKHHPELIITSATFQLAQGDINQISETVREYTRTRVAKQDIGEKCAGCMFKNPKNAFAGKFIEDAGLKGFTIGGARVSTKHANFIVNEGSATARDVRAVVAHIQEKVKKDFGIALETEIQNIF